VLHIAGQKSTAQSFQAPGGHGVPGRRFCACRCLHGKELSAFGSRKLLAGRLACAQQKEKGLLPDWHAAGAQIVAGLADGELAKVKDPSTRSVL
jgi:hypothetical protein